MKLPLSIAYKLLEIAGTGTGVPASLMPGTTVSKMVEDGILHRKQVGRTRALLYVRDAPDLQRYLLNQFGIEDLLRYVQVGAAEETTRGDAIAVSGDSKLRTLRTFTGFMLNCFDPIPATFHHEVFTVHPVPGTFTFLYDYKDFQPAPTVTIVGIENAENFRYIESLRTHFHELLPLFVCRYPQSNDLIAWLKMIPNQYLHFGDFDFAGTHIFMNEYKRYLGERASFFIPLEVEALLDQFGNRDLYNKQLHLAREWQDEPGIPELVRLFHKHKKVLEQEIFIKR